MLENIRIILVNPSHPGNIGAAARAMKNMGQNRLYLVSPKDFPHEGAIARAAGADDVLKNVKVVDDLKDALIGCEVVYGTSARTRALSWPIMSVRECAQEIATAEKGREIAIVFGCEHSGLSNEELAHCHYHIYIPTVKEFSSLNLAAAVQVIVYEIFVSLQKIEFSKVKQEDINYASADQIIGLCKHFEQTMHRIKFLSPKHPRLLLQRIRRLFTRARLEKNELNILRGFLSAVDKFIK